MLNPPPAVEQQAADPAAAAAEGKFVQQIRGRSTRSLSSIEREEIAAIVKDKPKIDLEINFDYNSADISAKSLPSVQALGRALTNAIDLTRRLTVDLSPPILQGEGLYHAIVWLGSRMKEEYGLELTVQVATAWRPLDQGLRVALFQIVRELLFNVVKHAGVGAATVTLSQMAQDVTLVVRDAGVGFDTQQAITSGRGLRQARQRVELYGGHLALDTRPGAGTAITITARALPTTTCAPPTCM